MNKQEIAKFIEDEFDGITKSFDILDRVGFIDDFNELMAWHIYNFENDNQCFFDCLYEFTTKIIGFDSKAALKDKKLQTLYRKWCNLSKEMVCRQRSNDDVQNFDDNEYSPILSEIEDRLYDYIDCERFSELGLSCMLQDIIIDAGDTNKPFEDFIDEVELELKQMEVQSV